MSARRGVDAPKARGPEADAPTDADLVAAYRTGDERAAATLVHRHLAAVGRFLYSTGAGTSDIEDLTQETFFRAFRSVHGWRAEASFRSWLFTIAGNLLKDDYRRRKGRQVVSIDDRDIPDHADPEADLAAAEAEERMRRELGRLPRLQREVFLLRAQEGRSYEDIAVALGTTPGAARVHYHHAVKRLKELVR
ncbi:MAG TPA: RNA polymerase sigma factor [Gemmatimonadales bacterium]|nr:RNA polymerase sigma factor [Gemmatimonadales bacterium]